MLPNSDLDASSDGTNRGFACLPILPQIPKRLRRAPGGSSLAAATTSTSRSGPRARRRLRHTRSVEVRLVPSRLVERGRKALWTMSRPPSCGLDSADSRRAPRAPFIAVAKPQEVSRNLLDLGPPPPVRPEHHTRPLAGNELGVSQAEPRQGGSSQRLGQCQTISRPSSHADRPVAGMRALRPKSPSNVPTPTTTKGPAPKAYQPAPTVAERSSPPPTARSSAAPQRLRPTTGDAPTPPAKCRPIEPAARVASGAPSRCN